MMLFRFATCAALITAAMPAVAQEVSATATVQSPSSSQAERGSDISVFSQHGGPLKEGDGTFNVQGGIYRWKKRSSAQTFWKFGAGVGSSFTIPTRRTQPVSSDSAFNIETWKDERVYLVLGGVETQRLLRKGIYLTAGLEIQAGGSQGRLDSVARQIPVGTNTTLNGDLIGSPVRLAGTHQFFRDRTSAARRPVL